MIRELVRLGEAALEGNTAELLEALIAPIEKVGKPARGQKPLLVILDLRSDPPKLKKRVEELDPEKARAYLWLGNPPRNNPKIRVTTNRLDYLLGLTFYELNKKKENGSLPIGLQDLIDRVFSRLLFIDYTANKHYAHLLNLLTLGLIEHEAWQETLKKPPKDRAKALAEHLRARWGLPKSGVLYTLAIDGTAIAQTPEYAALMLKTLVDEAFEGAEEGLCHACGKRAPVTGNFTRFQLKFFINDKASFAYGLNPQNWAKNFALCRDCYQKALAGERYLLKHLRLQVLGTPTLLVPHLGPGPLSREDLDALSEKLTRAVTGLEQLEFVPELLSKMSETIWTRLPQLTLFFIAGLDGKTTKVLEAVPEVEPSRMEEVLRALDEANNQATWLFGPGPFKDHWLGGLTALLFLLPIYLKKEKGTANSRRQEPKPIVVPALQSFRQILLAEPRPRAAWVRGFLEVLRHAWHKSPRVYGTRSCRDPSSSKCPELEWLLPQMAAFLVFLARLGLVEVESVETIEAGSYTEAIKELGLGSQGAALFLLGVLLARVASEQCKKHLRTGEKGKKQCPKPILEKVGYQGMPLEKVERFAVELFEKLAEYRRLDANSEVVFATASELLAREKNRWRLSDEENAFYILLGYGYETRRILRQAAERAGKGEEA